jgi:hypothetical protein
MQKKMHNYMLKKKEKRNDIAEHRTHANPPPKAHTQNPNGSGYA